MLNQSPSSRNIFTVTKLNRLARSVLESEIGQIWLSAEISNFVAASSGHWYFTLKDSRTQVRAAMFRGSNSKVLSKPKEGDKVLVKASVGLYEARGDYQLIVDFIEPEGEGRLKQAFEALKIKLAAEGLFAQQTKQTLPAVINTVGVVTSATGAALHDILTVLRRRNPLIKVIVYPTQVQGATASEMICAAINKAQQRREVEVLIVGRGGGSLEDLWCFNEEHVARTIFACSIPIVSAVGHEVDVTIADFVADLRAPTPSAAAELVSNDQAEVMQGLDRIKKQLLHYINKHLIGYNHQLTVSHQRLSRLHPESQIRQQSQHLDRLSSALQRSFVVNHNKRIEYANALHKRLSMASPQRTLRQSKQNNQELGQRLHKALQHVLAKQHLRLASIGQLLDAVSPLATLSRGYSITYSNNEIVRSIEELNSGDVIVSKLIDGEVVSKVN